MTDSAASGEKRPTYVGRVLVFVAIVALALLLWALRHVVLLIFASVLIAVALNGLASAVAKRTPLSRGWALALSALVILALFVGAFWLFGAQVGAQVRELVTRIPEALETLRSRLAETPLGVETARQVEDAVTSTGAQRAFGALGSIGGWALSFASAALSVFLVIIGGIFLAADPAPYRNGLLILFPRKARAGVSEALDDSNRALVRWLLGTLVSMVAVAVMTGLALWLLGVPAFLALALIAGLSQFVPVIGPLLASVPAMLLGLTVSPLTPLWVAASAFGVSTIESNFLTPIIQKKAVSLQPALMLFAIVGIGFLFGPLGALLAIPLVVVVTIFVIRFYVNGLLGETETPPGSPT